MARYLVTGVAGFIGSKVAEGLLKQGHSVLGVDILNDAYDVRLKEWRLGHLCKFPRLEFERVSICDRAAIDRLFRNTRADGSFDAVFNLAAWAGVRWSVENPWVYFDTNVTGTLNLLEACKTHHVNKFVLASSSSLYGADNPTPWQEDQDTDHPVSPYAASKKAAETLCFTYHQLWGIDVTILRYFTVFGPAGRPDMMPFRFAQWICEGRQVVVYGDGQQYRDFTYVDDIAQGTIAGLKPLGYDVINLGSDRPRTVMNAIHVFEESCGAKAKLVFRRAHPADVPRTWADITKAKRLLGWSPIDDFGDGIGRLVEWYRANRAWAKDIKTGEQAPGTDQLVRHTLPARDRRCVPRFGELRHFEQEDNQDL